MTATDDAEGRIHARPEGDLFVITIDRPKKLNGFTPRMLTELAAAYTAMEHLAEVRCGVLCAEGPHFTAGLDLPKVAPFMAGGGSLFPQGSIDPLMRQPPWRSKPLVVAVQGICFTIGIELMLAADVVVAADDCRFSQLEVKRAIMASGGATIRMVERAGFGNAMRYLLTGDEFDAATALRLGFVQEVVPAGQQLARATELARRIADQAPLAVQATLANARIALQDGFAAAVADFEPTQRRLMASADVKEGLRSFIEMRPAKFEGR